MHLITSKVQDSEAMVLLLLLFKSKQQLTERARGRIVAVIEQVNLTEQDRQMETMADLKNAKEDLQAYAKTDKQKKLRKYKTQESSPSEKTMFFVHSAAKEISMES